MNARTGHEAGASAVSTAELVITPVSGKADLKAFVDLPWAIYADDPNWVPQLKDEIYGLLTPGKNPFHEHAEHQYFLARRGEDVVGRISAHYDKLALGMPPEQGMGPGTGNFGLFEAKDAEVAAALIKTAEGWLRAQGMTHVLGPISLSIWEEPGLLVKGHDHPPTVMMGHNSAAYEAWVERAGYTVAKRLLTYDLPIKDSFPPLINKIVEMGEKNPRIRIRQVEKKHFDRDAAIFIDILNDAWSQNWGFVPFTETEKKYGAKKLGALIYEDVNMIAELDGEPVAFMMALPDVNAPLRSMGGKLFSFNFIKLLWWLHKGRPVDFRVPLMGVVQKLQGSRMASQLAFMMIEYIRRNGVGKHGAKRAEVGWILEDNQGMVAIADAIGSKVNREYRIYGKQL